MDGEGVSGASKRDRQWNGTIGKRAGECGLGVEATADEGEGHSLGVNHCLSTTPTKREHGKHDDSLDQAQVKRGTRQLINVVFSSKTKKVVLRLECASCKTKHQLTLKRCKQYVLPCGNSRNHHSSIYHSFELGGDKRQKGAALTF